MDNINEINTEPLGFDEIFSVMATAYESEYKSVTGEDITLAPADEETLVLKSVAAILVQGYLYTEHLAKQNMLKTASGVYLDNIADTRANLQRLPASKAVTTLKFTCIENAPTDVLVPKGTRVSAGDKIFFATDSDLTINPKNITGTVNATCTVFGAEGNSYKVDTLNVIVDPIPFVLSVTNLSQTQGGTDVESDGNFRDRIYNNPSSLSVAGPQSAYEYLIKNYSQEISDCKVSSPSAGEVDIRILLSNGEIPNSALLDKISAYISGKDKRPLTDNVTVSAPTILDYALELTYYIDSADTEHEDQIKALATEEIENYILWQKSKISRDINPDELIRRLLNVGVKRAVITSPVFTKVADNKVAKETDVTIHYGGIESE